MKSFKQYIESKLNENENTNQHRFIYYGTGSGNVYGVSNAPTIQAAVKEFLQTVVRMDSGDASDAEYEKVNPEYHDGYVSVYMPGSMEGEFIALDTQSNNPRVQKEIQSLGLLKGVEEYLKYNK